MKYLSATGIRWLRWCPMVLSLCFLVGCGSSENIRYSSIDEKLSTENPGYVGFVVAASQDRVQSWVWTWHSLLVRDTSTNITHVISAKEKLDSANQVYLGALPPGTYQAERLFAQYRYDSGVVTAWYNLNDTGLVFDIVPGKFINLGGLAYHGNKDVVEVADPETSFWKKLFSRPSRTYSGDPSVEYFATDIPYRVFQQVQKNQLEVAPINRTIADSVGKPAVAPIRERLDRVPTLTRTTITEDNNKLIYGYFGTVLFGKPDGEWQLLYAPGLYQLTAAAMLDEENLVFGDEFGQLYRYNHRLNEWSQLTSPLPLGNITLLDRITDNQLLVVQRNQEEHTVQLLDVERGTLSHLAQFEHDNDDTPKSLSASSPFLKIRTNPSFVIQRLPDSIRYFMGDRIWSFDKATTTLKPESSDTYSHAYLQANGILAVEPNDFFSPNFLISKDHGEHWINPLRGTKTNSELERRSYVGEKGHLLMLSRSQVRSGVAYYYAEAKVQYSDNLAQSWDILGEIPEDCQDLLHEISNDDAVYLYCQGGDLMLTRDFGQHWEPVYLYEQPDLSEPQDLRT